MGKKLKTVQPNYIFIMYQISLILIALIVFVGIIVGPLKGIPKNLTVVNGLVLFCIGVLPVLGLVIMFIRNIIRLGAKLELYENGIELNGKKYFFSELGQLRFMKTNYLFLGSIQTPVSYYTLYTDVKKVEISELYFNKVHQAFMLTYENLRYGGMK